MKMRWLVVTDIHIYQDSIKRTYFWHKINFSFRVQRYDYFPK